MILGSVGMIGSAGVEIGSDGLATPAVVVAVAASSTAIVHGSNVTVNAWENIWKDDAPTTKATDKNGRVNADGNGGFHEPTGSLKGKKIGHTFSKHGSHNTHQLMKQAENSKCHKGNGLTMQQWKALLLKI